jgi:hypothetical protein
MLAFGAVIADGQTIRDARLARWKCQHAGDLDIRTSTTSMWRSAPRLGYDVATRRGHGENVLDLGIAGGNRL